MLQSPGKDKINKKKKHNDQTEINKTKILTKAIEKPGEDEVNVEKDDEEDKQEEEYRERKKGDI